MVCSTTTTLKVIIHWNDPKVSTSQRPFTYIISVGGSYSARGEVGQKSVQLPDTVRDTGGPSGSH